eukprot:scaffold15945_cov106-Isochrysis_galbana.AAC.1
MDRAPPGAACSNRSTGHGVYTPGQRVWRAPFGPASLRNRHRAGRGTEARAAAPRRVTGPAGRHGAEARARVPSKTRVPSAQPSKAPVPSAPRVERAVWRARLRLRPSSRRWSRSYGGA